MEKLIYLIDDFESTVNRLLQDEELTKFGMDKEKISETLTYFKGDEIATSVFLKKYALKNNNNQIVELTLSESKDRWANAIVQGDNLFPNQKGFQYFRNLYDYFLPGGRQMFALGNCYVPNATFSNCYVTQIDNDDIQSIFDAIKVCAKTYSYGGGIGLCIGGLRPKGAKVSNSAKFSSGAVSFMELFSATTGLIGQSGRRGALMITCPVSHPDIEDFIEIKHNNTEKVKFANISIKITDEFMRAVESDSKFTLRFTTSHEVIEREVNARELWNKIVVSARDSAEPGILFWDRAVEMSPSDVYPEARIHATNPCGEILLPASKNGGGGSCNLGSLLLHKFVVNPYTKDAYFDVDLFKEVIRGGMRHLDNIIELNYGRHPIQGQNDFCLIERRIGLGLTGLADMMASLGIRYDSKEAIEKIHFIMNIKMLTEYDESIELAKDRGSFKIYDPNKHFTRGFASYLPQELIDKAKTYGLRNITMSTIAPNGSLSIIAQCSSGCEPIFSLSYKRNVVCGGTKKQFEVRHQGVTNFFDINKDAERLPDYWVTAHEIDYNKRIEIQSALQQYTDSSISSCLSVNDTNLFITDKGLLTSKEVISGHNGEETFLDCKEAIKSINNKNNLSLFSQTYNNGIKDTLKIILTGNFEIEATRNHKIEILDINNNRIWKRLDEISIGDIAVMRSGLNLWNNNGNTISKLINKNFIYERKSNSKNVTIPKIMTKDLALLIGILQNDGCIGINGIGLTQVPNNVGPIFIKLVQDIFNINIGKTQEDKRSENQLFQYVVNSREVSAFFKYLGLTNNHNENVVPEIIRKSGVNIIKSYIRGLTLDGFVFKTGGLGVITSSSKVIIQQLQVILLNLGIFSTWHISNKQDTLRTFPGGKTYNTQKGYELVISNKESINLFNQKIKFLEEDKQELLDKKILHNTIIRNKNILYGQVYQSNYSLDFCNRNLPTINSSFLYNHFHSLTSGGNRSRKLINRDTLQQFRDLGLDIQDYLLDPTYTFLEVKEIQNGQTCLTMDVSVPDGNSYVLNGFVSHNTVNIPNETTVEEVSDIYMKAWKNNLKGITVYREGSREGILITKDTKEVKNDVDTIIHCVHAEGGDKFYVMISYRNGDIHNPYQAFVTNYKKCDNDAFVKIGNSLVKMLKDNGVQDDRLDKYSERSDSSLAKFTRFLSLSLKTGNLNNALKILNDHAFAGTLALKLYEILSRSVQDSPKCFNCSSSNIRKEEGCITCLDCGISKCG